MPKKPRNYLNPADWAAGAALAYRAGRAIYDRVAGHGKPAFPRVNPALKAKSGSKLATKTKTKTGYMAKTADKAKSFYEKKNELKLSEKILKELSGLNIAEASYALRVQATSGRQGAASYLLADSSPLQVMLNTIGITANSSKKMFVDSVYATVEIANASTAPSHVGIYDLMFRKDMDGTTATNDNLSPEGCWNAGEIEEGDALGYTNVESYPSKVSRFEKCYTILNKENLLMMPGEVHSHVFSLKLRKWVKQQEVSDYLRLAYRTHAIMIAGHGTPADAPGSTDLSGVPSLDASGNFNVAGFSGVISTTPVALNAIMKVRYTFRWMDDIDDDIKVMNTITVVPALEVATQIGTVVPSTTT